MTDIQNLGATQQGGHPVPGKKKINVDESIYFIFHNWDTSWIGIQLIIGSKRKDWPTDMCLSKTVQHRDRGNTHWNVNSKH